MKATIVITVEVEDAELNSVEVESVLPEPIIEKTIRSILAAYAIRDYK